MNCFGDWKTCGLEMQINLVEILRSSNGRNCWPTQIQDIKPGHFFTHISSVSIFPRMSLFGPVFPVDRVFNQINSEMENKVRVFFFLKKM